MNQETWEERFDEGCNADNISDPPSDREWIKSFIRQEKELSRKEERARIKTMAENMITVVEQMDTDFSQGQVDALDGLIQKINQEDK